MGYLLAKNLKGVLSKLQILHTINFFCALKKLQNCWERYINLSQSARSAEKLEKSQKGDTKFAGLTAAS